MFGGQFENVLDLTELPILEFSNLNFKLDVVVSRIGLHIFSTLDKVLVLIPLKRVFELVVVTVHPKLCSLSKTTLLDGSFEEKLQFTSSKS